MCKKYKNKEVNVNKYFENEKKILIGPRLIVVKLFLHFPPIVCEYKKEKRNKRAFMPNAIRIKTN